MSGVAANIIDYGVGSHLRTSLRDCPSFGCFDEASSNPGSASFRHYIPSLDESHRACFAILGILPQPRFQEAPHSSIRRVVKKDGILMRVLKKYLGVALVIDVGAIGPQLASKLPPRLQIVTSQSSNAHSYHLPK